MATFVNDLRLTELATGEGSGTWGTTTNTNLELIAESFSFGTEAITTNADTHTTTIADGSTDPGRSLFLKYTGTLDSTCTITIGPNTVSKLWFIENATSGSQSIIVSQGSGASITIPNGQTKAIYSDGAGSGAAMVDAFQDLSVPDLFVDDDLTIGDDLVFSSDSAVITFGADGDTTLTHTDGSGLTLNSTNKLMFNDASQFIQGSSATVLSLGATDEIDLTATAIDVNGTIDVSGNATLGGTLGVTGAVTANAGVSIDNITIDGTEIDLSSGDLTIDVAGDIILDADGGDVNFKDAGTEYLRITNAVSGPEIFSPSNDGDLFFKGVDGGSTITALTLDMSAAGIATFNSGINIGNRGSASDPTLQSAIDPDTGVFWGGSNILGFSSGGSEQLRVSANGVEQATGDFLYNGGGNFDIKHTTAGQNIVFSTTPSGGSTTEVLRITSDGNLGKTVGDLTIDVAGDIILDADGGDFNFKDGGTTLLGISNAGSNNVQISTSISDGDLLIKGNDGGSIITALTLDMSAAGAATFNAGATFSGVVQPSSVNSIDLGANGAEFRTLYLDTSIISSNPLGIVCGTHLEVDVGGNIKLDADDAGEVRFLDGGTQYAQIKKDGNNALFQSIVADGDFLIQGITGSSFVTAVTFDMSSSGSATFGGNVICSDIKASGSGGLALQTDDGVKRIIIEDDGDVVINETGANSDFRVESQGSTQGLFLDASTGHVSMGVTADTTTYGGTFRLLQIGNGAGYGIFNGLTSATANDAGVASFFGQTSGTSGYDVVGGMRIALAADSSSNSEGKIEFYTATGGNLVEAMEITNSQQLILHGVKDDTTSDAANMNIRSSDGLVRRSTSSRRYKNTITDATHGLTELLKLRSVTYKGNNDGDRLFGGLIAEEVHDAGLTEFVQYNSDDEPDALAYGHMVSLCIKAIQEQQALIETLQAEVAALKGE